jgi:immunity protein, SdpI family
VTAVALAFEIGIAAYGFSRVPSGAQVAIHWDAVGHPNGYGSALFAFTLVPVLSAAISAGLAFLPSIEPRRRNLLMSAAAYTAVWISVVLLMAAVQAAIVFSATGLAKSETVARLVPAAVGVMLAVVGNYLGKVRSNFFFGIRTPWTLSSERSWNRTHRLGGRLFIAVGLTAAATSVFPFVGFVVVTAGALAVVVILFVYSYVEWSRDPAKLPLGRVG